MSERILVTGGFGFLGRYVVEELLKASGLEVVVLSVPNEKIPPSLSNLQNLPVDVRNAAGIISEVKNFDRIYHLAGNVKTSTTDKRNLHYEINEQGTLNLLKACSENHIGRFIFISTCEVYGSSSGENVRENSTKNPDNDYAKSKLSAEIYCEDYSNRVKVTVIRPSYIYGHGMNSERLFSKLIKSAVCDQKIELVPSSGGNDFVYVKDVASGIVLLGERQQDETFDDFNISSGEFSEVRKVFDIIKGLTGIDYPNLRPQTKKDEGRFSLNIDKACRLGYSPKYNLRSGLKDFIESYKRDLNL